MRVAKRGRTDSEVISLAHRPLAGTNMLIVKNVSTITSAERLHLCLGEAGLIDNLNWDGESSWATVQFFSRLEAQACVRECDGRILDGRILRVALLAPQKAPVQTPAPPLPLSLLKVSEVMSHFLGFSGWSHEISSVRRVSHSEPKPGQNLAEVEVYAAHTEYISG